VFLNCAVWDIQRGPILKLAEGKIITHAMLGFRKLTSNEIINMYGDPPVFNALRWPETNRMMDREENAHWIFVGRTDACKVPVICQVIELI
jgi:hypothetical protein